MLRKYVKILLFLVSYIPLFIILLIKNNDNDVLVYSILILVFVPLVLIYFMYKSVKNISGDYVKIDKIENVNRISLEYFVAYIIPFLDFKLNEIPDALSLIILLLFMCFIYVKSDLLYLNPILNILGFNVFKIISEKRELMIITKKNIGELKDSEEIIPLSNDVLLGKIGWNSTENFRIFEGSFHHRKDVFCLKKRRGLQVIPKEIGW